MPTSAHSARLTFTALAALTVAGCGDASVGGPALPARLVIASASHQIGLPGQTVPSPPIVKVTTAAGAPISGATVTFAVTAGGGAIAQGTGVSGANGHVEAAWTLGDAGPQTLQASLDGVPTATVSFSADAVAPSGYTIDLVFLTTPTDTQRAAFTSAASRIQEIIVGGVTPVVVTGASCAGTALTGTVDGLRILVQLTDIDGPGGILGKAGPCVYRSTTMLPAAGSMEFDTADLDDLEARGQLQATILHEMLHVVGFGTIWDLASPRRISGARTRSSAFTGPAALAAATGFNGAPSSWTSVPVENCGSASPSGCGPGSQDSHWLEPTFKTELMTGWLSPGSSPLSRTTIGSLADLGYLVDLNAADPFDLGLSGLHALEPAQPGDALPLGDDVLHLPIETVP